MMSILKKFKGISDKETFLTSAPVEDRELE